MDDNISNIIEQFHNLCRNARTEDDIKGASNIFFNKIGEELGITISSHNEITSAHGGRVDSIYNNIYFEYKRLNLFTTAGYDGINEALFGRDDRDHGLFHYLVNFALEQCHNDVDNFLFLLTSSVGVGFDGNKFVFCRFKFSNTQTSLKIPYHYLCSVLNSNVIEQIIQDYTINTNRGTDIVKNIRIPKFDVNSDIHIRLAQLYMECHRAYKTKNISAISEFSNQINSLVHKLFFDS